MRRIIGGHTHAPTVMIAEYAQVKIETLTGGQPPVPHVVPHLILA
jgi:hypothetical protein